jgi:hypothetical protein
MSSEPKPQPAPEPRRRPRRAGEPGARRSASGNDPGAAELAGTLGYDPDNPATWPGNAKEVPADAASAAAPAAEPEDGEPVRLTDATAMRALAHPVRMALLELFGFRETLTATQASELLGESPANCAFHLRTLAKYGFVREAGGGKGRERPWTVVSRRMTLMTEQADPQAALAAGELGRIFFERWVDRTRRVLGSPNQVPGWDEASGWSDTLLFLTPDEVIRLREEMLRMLMRYEHRLTDPARRPAGAFPVEWTIVTAPVPEAADPSPGPDATGSQ